MNLSPHFTLEQLTVSEWAARAGIENKPSETELANLYRLAAALELVRYALGYDIEVRSAYRNEQVNKAVGGVSTSYHCMGLAADIVCPKFGTPVEVCRKLMSHTVLEFDQLIHEYGRWTHIGIAIQGKQPRLQALSVFRPGRYLAGILDKEP